MQNIDMQIICKVFAYFEHNNIFQYTNCMQIRF